MSIGGAASAWLSPARMRSSRFMSRETSYCQRGPSAISTAFRSVSAESVPGRSSATGIAAPATSAGTTRMLRPSAVSTSSRT